MSELPQGWVQTTVGAVTQAVATVKPKLDPAAAFTYVDIGSIDNAANAIVAPKVLLGAAAPSRARQLLRAGDTVFSTVRTYLRNIGYVTDELDGAVGSTGFSVLRPASGVNSRYLYYHSLTSAFVDGLTAVMRGTSYPAVVDSQVRGMSLPLAPTAEQERIVAAIEEQFSRLDVGEAILERIARNFGRMRAAVLQAAVTGRLVPQTGIEARTEQDSDSPLELPPGWTWTALRDVCSSITDGDHQPPPKTDQGIPFLVIGNVRNGRVDFRGCRHVSQDYYDSLLPTRRPQQGDVLYTLVGSYGITVPITDDHPFCVQRHIGILRPSPQVTSGYLAAALASSHTFAQARACATGTAQMTVPLSGLRKIMMPLPPLEEQERIVLELARFGGAADSFHEALERSASRASALRSAILKSAFSGALVPQDSSDEPALALLERVAAERASSGGHEPTRTRDRRGKVPA